VFGNVVLADHGLSVSDVPLPTVPSSLSFTRQTPPPTAASPRSPLLCQCAIGPCFLTVLSLRLSLCPWPAVRHRIDRPSACQLIRIYQGYEGFYLSHGAGLGALVLARFIRHGCHTNAVVSGNSICLLVYAPPGSGWCSGSPVLESFVNLSINPAARTLWPPGSTCLPGLSRSRFLRATCHRTHGVQRGLPLSTLREPLT